MRSLPDPMNPDGQSHFEPQARPAVHPSLDSHAPVDPHPDPAVERSSIDHCSTGIQTGIVDGPTSGEGQDEIGSHEPHALPGSDSPHAIAEAGTKHLSREGTLSDPVASLHPLTIWQALRGPILSSGYLMLLSDSLDDIEQLRIATENRVRALTRDVADSDGEHRGLGLDARSPEVATAMGMLDTLKVLENQATLALRREVRRSPLYGWIQRNKGIGEKQAGRLLAVVGDPYWNTLHDRPRTVSELWAYAGYSVIGGEAQRRRKGQASNWSDKAKSRAFLMAQSCVKSLGGHYRGVYDSARLRYADRLHEAPCVRCGPAGKPAQPGTPLSPGHQHARALRIVSKEILRDLWIEARGIYEYEEKAA